MTNSSFLYMKILWRRSTETEIAFGERRSPAASLRMALHAGSMHSERTGFSPGASASVAASARVSRQVRRLFAARADLLLHAPKKCKESVFEPPILLQNQANPQILLQF